MTTYAEQTGTEPVLPPSPARPQPTPNQQRPSAADHVRTHGRACWWNVDECRWECRRG